MKVFLSYGHDGNTDLVLRIKRDLKAAGHTPWIDTSGIEHGDDWRRSILDGLSDTQFTLAFLSRHAVREDGVCLDEIALALGMRHGNLATILVEPEDEVQAPVSVGHIQWLDMSDWATQDEPHEPRQCQAGRARAWAGGGDRRLRPGDAIVGGSGARPGVTDARCMARLSRNGEATARSGGRRMSAAA